MPSYVERNGKMTDQELRMFIRCKENSKFYNCYLLQLDRKQRHMWPCMWKISSLPKPENQNLHRNADEEILQLAIWWPYITSYKSQHKGLLHFFKDFPKFRRCFNQPKWRDSDSEIVNLKRLYVARKVVTKLHWLNSTAWYFPMESNSVDASCPKLL